mgnify:CR=1 FL=1
MAKQLAYDADARAALKRGVDKVADAVRITIGPKGRNVVLDKPFGSPTITNDGVTIAKEIEPEDAFENMGAQLVKEAAITTNDIVGDGTPTATVIAQAFVPEGPKASGAGRNPILVSHDADLAHAASAAPTDTVARPQHRDTASPPAAGSVTSSGPRWSCPSASGSRSDRRPGQFI